MATSCSICGETLQSDGAAGLHELVAHLNPQPPVPPPGPPPPPPPGPGGGPWPAPARPAGGAGSTRVIGVVAGVVAALIGVFVGRAAVAELLDRDRSAPPAQELAADQVGGADWGRADFRTVSKADKGFSIGLPESMDELPMTAEALDESVALLESLNPTLASVLKGNDALVDQVRLFAIDPDTGTTQLVQRVRVGRGADVDDIPRGTFSGEYRKYGATSADEAVVRLPAGKAVLVSAQLPMGASTVSVTQYVLARDGYAWILTTSGLNSAEDGADIASTFRFE